MRHVRGEKVKVYCVLRSGGDLSSTDVGLLQVCLERNLPGYPLHCLSDVEVVCKTVPLLYSWPKWWAKMELFRPDIKGDIFYLDLDTLVVGDISHMLAESVDTMLSDFYYPWRVGSGLMYLTEETRRTVWDEWIRDPWNHMITYDKGDQTFLASTRLNKAKRWQVRYPGQVISFKRHMRPSFPFPPGEQLGKPPSSARVVCFHGLPRPQQIWHEEWVKEAWA